MLLAVAALCVIMAFGAIAGAAGWLRLGDVEGDETAAAHGSSLHKAEQEVYNYEKGIPPEEWRKIDVYKRQSMLSGDTVISIFPLEEFEDQGKATVYYLHGSQEDMRRFCQETGGEPFETCLLYTSNLNAGRDTFNPVFIRRRL